MIPRQQAITVMMYALGWSTLKATHIYDSAEVNQMKHKDGGIAPHRLGDVIRRNYPDRNNSEY